MNGARMRNWAATSTCARRSACSEKSRDPEKRQMITTLATPSMALSKRAVRHARSLPVSLAAHREPAFWSRVSSDRGHLGDGLQAKFQAATGQTGPGSALLAWLRNSRQTADITVAVGRPGVSLCRHSHRGCS
jgi:hypothetical protein